MGAPLFRGTRAKPAARQKRSGNLGKNTSRYSHRRRLHAEQLEERRLLTITVNTVVDEMDTSNDQVSLRDAISLATPGETIDFDSSLDGQTIRLMQDLGELNITQSLVIDATALPNGISVDANDPTPEPGDGIRIFEIDDGDDDAAQDVEIRGLTLIGGDVSTSGGAIRSRENLTLTRSTISGNSALEDGGGVSAGAYDALGNSITTSIMDSVISDNRSREDGGGVKAYGAVQIQTTTVTGNSALNGGGGLSLRSGYDGRTVSVQRSTISGNEARVGGGLYLSGNTEVVNSTISGNRARADGGGVFLFSSSYLSIRLSTITDNAADVASTEGIGQGGGIWAGFSQSLILLQTIVAANYRPNVDGNIHDDVFATVNDSSSFNVIGVDSGLSGISDGANGNQIGRTGDALDPLLGPLADNGGPTQTHALRLGSPAIDAGDPDFAPPPATDQRGSPFLREFAATFMIDPFTTDSGPTVDEHPPGTPVEEVFTAPEAIGGQRDFTVELTSGNAGDTVQMATNNGDLSINPDFFAAGNYTVTWDGIDSAGDGLNPEGLGGVDLTVGGGIAGFYLPDVLFDQAGAIICVRVYSSASEFSEAVISGIDPLEMQSYFIPFSDFTTVGTAGADFTNVGAIELEIQATQQATDGKLTQIGLFGIDRVDVGAYELQSLGPLTLVVDILVDENDGDTSPGDLSLREAVGLTNGNVGIADVILFDPALDDGTIRLTLGELVITDSVTIDASSLAQRITVDASGNDPTPDDDNLDGTRVFRIDDLNGFGDGIFVELRSLALAGGDVDGDGGAIRSTENLTLTDVMLNDNAAIRGGGIYNRFGDVMVVGSTIVRNVARSIEGSSPGGGGGIYSQYGSVTVSNSTISGNFAQGLTDVGGGIAFRGDLHVTGSTISDNYARLWGGGVSTALGGEGQSSASISDSTVSGNTAISGGGGIYSESGDLYAVRTLVSGNAGGSGGGILAFGADARFVESTISGNTAFQGAGLFVAGGVFVSGPATIALDSSTISGNSAEERGGGIYAGPGASISVMHSTVSGNSASDGGGIFSYVGLLVLNHSIVANSTSGGDLLADDPTANFSLIEDPANTFIIGANNILGEDPQLGPLADNGGPTQTHALLSSSPAIDAGDPMIDTPPPTDQRGRPRILDGNLDGFDVIDIGAFEALIAGGQKFHDLNGDGLQDESEPRLSGWTIELDLFDDGSVDVTRVTDEDGTFEFDVIPLGTHRVREVIQPGWMQTRPISPDGYLITLDGNDSVAGLDFGNFQLVTISGVKFDDIDGDGVSDADPPYLGGVEVELFFDVNGDGVFDPDGLDGPAIDRTTTSNLNGSYEFSGVGPGTYFVRENPDSLANLELIQTEGGDDFAGGLNYFTITTLSGNNVPGRNFWNFERITLQGTKFDDTDGDGASAADPPYLSGVEMELYLDVNGDGMFEPDGADGPAIATATTSDMDGSYEFPGVEPGTYFVRENPDSLDALGLIQTDGGDAFDDGANYYTITAVSGIDASELDFWNFELTPIRGAKFDDTDGDGAAGSADPPYLGGVQIELYRDVNGDGLFDPDGVDGPAIATTMTSDVDGSYEFAGLGPDTYFVRENPDSLVALNLVQTDGGDDFADGVDYYTATTRSGDEVDGLDFWNFERVPIRGVKFVDTDGDGAAGADPPYLGGVQIELYRDVNGDGMFEPDGADGPAVDTATTSDIDGSYVFTGVGPGTYFVRENPESLDALELTQTDGGDDFAGGVFYYTIAARSGIEETALDFWNFERITIRGTKFEDTDGDGASGADPPYLGGVEIDLYHDANEDGIFEPGGADGPVVDSVTTSDIDGSYVFAGVGPGTYFVRENPDSLATLELMQTDGGDDFAGDVEYYTVTTVSGNAVAGRDFWNFELITIEGLKYNDLNGNAVQDDGEFGLAGWTMDLDLNSDGIIDRTATTNAGGVYRFDLVGPGTHRISERRQTDWAQTQPSAVALSTGLYAGFVTTADLDGQHGWDLVVANNYSDPVLRISTVSIMFSNGMGGFDPPVNVELNPQVRPQAILAANLVGNAEIDLAVATIGDGTNSTANSNSVVILQNMGNRQFEIQGVYPTCRTTTAGVCDVTAGRGPVSIAGGDFDNDGDVDLVTANVKTNDISVLTQDGRGNYTLSSILPVGNRPVSVAVDNLNPSDGDALDIITANLESNDVSILLGEGNGRFEAGASVSGLSDPTAVVLSDLDDDDQLDLAVTNRASNEVSVLPGRGDGTFGSGVQLTVGRLPGSIAAGHVLGTDLPDLVVANTGGSSLSILANRSSPGNLMFGPADPLLPPSPNTATGVHPQSVAVGPLDGDAPLDIATAFSIGGGAVIFSGGDAYQISAVSGTNVLELDFGNQYTERRSLPQTDLAATIDSSVATTTPGESISYTIVVSNAGPSSVSRAEVASELDSALSNVTYTSSTTGNVTGNSSSGTGEIDDLVNMAPGSTIEYVVTVEVAANASDRLTSHVTVSAPGDRAETNLGNNRDSAEVLVVRQALSAMDMNHDGHVGPLDALLIINYLSIQSSGSSADMPGSLEQFDVTRDGVVSPLDALWVINHLGQSSVPRASSSAGTTEGIHGLSSRAMAGRREPPVIPVGSTQPDLSWASTTMSDTPWGQQTAWYRSEERRYVTLHNIVETGDTGQGSDRLWPPLASAPRGWLLPEEVDAFFEKLQMAAMW